jgi:hypothetical protein
MKKFLIVCCFSFAIFAEPTFYELVKSNQSDNTFATDLSTKNTEQSFVDQLASLLYGKDAETNLSSEKSKPSLAQQFASLLYGKDSDAAKQTIESTALKKPGLWQRMANKVKGIFGYGETASTNQGNSVDALQFLMQNKPASSSEGEGLLSKLANGYQTIKKNPYLLESIKNFIYS